MDLYKEELLHYYKIQPNKKHLTDGNFFGKSVNTSCGDEICLELKIDDKGIIRDIGYSHGGCIVSGAVMSMMAEQLIGKKFAYVKSLSPDEWLSEIGFDLTDSRKKCALVGYRALKDCKKV